jgi:NAD(P)-dependent dehydrogenase (short-subunit alcohol dehydrogenase family)
MTVVADRRPGVEGALVRRRGACYRPRVRSVLITGCSSGIGHDAAHALRARGWRVFASCRKAEDCERLGAEGFESPRLDYQDGETIRAAFAEVAEATGGGPDALFNNGAFALPGALEDVPTEGLRAIFEANFFGWHELVRLAIPAMRARGRGRIVQCSSVLGLVGVRMRGAYVATKFAVEGHADTLRLELAGTGIDVVLIEPGPIGTRFRVNARPHYERWIDRERTPWAAFYRDVLEKRLYAVDPGPDPMELPPSAVSAKLVRALESRRPAARYYVTTPTYMVGLAKRLLPARWLDAILMRG